jgi:hypothetical protein
LYNNSLILSGALWDLRQSFRSTYGEVDGTRRADAMILYAFKQTRPTNFSQFMSSIIQISAGAEFNGGVPATIATAQDRQAICTAFNFNHGLTPDNATIGNGYCARPGTPMLLNETLNQTTTFAPTSQISMNGTGFAPRTNATMYILEAYYGDAENPAYGGTLADFSIIPGIPVNPDAYGNFGTITAWNSAQEGNYELIIDTNQNGAYDPTIDTLVPFTVAYPFHCDISLPDQVVNVQNGQKHYLSIFGQPEFPIYSSQTACRKFILTNSLPIASMQISDLLFDDEGYVAINGHIVHYWWPRPRAPLTNRDINISLTPYINTSAGASNTILAYVKDIYTVVYGGIVQVRVGDTPACVQTGGTAAQDSECCTGTRDAERGVCLCKAAYTYAETQDAPLCCSGVYTPRICAPTGYAPPGGQNLPGSGEVISPPMGEEFPLKGDSAVIGEPKSDGAVPLIQIPENGEEIAPLIGEPIPISACLDEKCESSCIGMECKSDEDCKASCVEAASCIKGICSAPVQDGILSTAKPA